MPEPSPTPTLTPEHVLAAAESWYPDRSPRELLGLLRSGHDRFVPAWLSARATREELPAPLVAELAEVREHTERIRELDRMVRAAVPAARASKGLAIAACYPDWLARKMADLDVVVPDVPTAWRAAEAVAAATGAEVRGVSTFPDGPGRHGLMVGMVLPTPLPLAPPLYFDVSTHVLVGNGTTVPARAWIGRPGELELAAQLVLVAAKPLERPYGLKQVLDASVLAGALGPAGLARARQLAGPLGLLPELRAVLELAGRHGLPVPANPVGPGTARRARLARAARFALADRRRPLAAALRVLQHVEVNDPAGFRTRRRVWRAVDRRLPVLSPARDGLFRFGLPVTVRGATERPLLRTPFGDYLLVTGSEVTEDWLDDGLLPVGAED